MKVGDLSPLMVELHGALHAGRHRLRRAAAGHSSIACARRHVDSGNAAPRRIKLILVEPYFDLKTPEAIARQDRRAGPRGWRPDVGANEEITDYIKLFDYDVALLVSVLGKSGAQ